MHVRACVLYVLTACFDVTVLELDKKALEFHCYLPSVLPNGAINLKDYKQSSL